MPSQQKLQQEQTTFAESPRQSAATISIGISLSAPQNASSKDPVNPVPSTITNVRFGRFEKPSGIEPTMPGLSEMKNDDRPDNLESCAGTVPLNSFKLKSKNSRSVNFESSLDRVPVKKLPETSSHWSCVKS
mmetsp:Transcript_14291/g.25600  ORF Transcript_14291/g.25600 Transcript_14291/m.25600 type:complete len:132 (-) Transcript_14291:134-529(-)